MNIIIRPETTADIAAIHALTESAFRDVPYSAHTEHWIVDALRDAGALTISLVAEYAGDIVGHVVVSPVTLSGSEMGWYGLGPVSVRPAMQKQGVGSLLIRDVLRQLQASGAAGCVLVGDPNYYQRFGFARSDTLRYPDLPAEFFQVLAFKGGVPHGVVRFHAAFFVEAS